jgi:uncharacterized protein with NRDE domain
VCTLIFAWQVFEDAPILLAANRDEAVGRPSQPPVWRDWGTRTLAPKDEEANGTWLGVNDHDVVVALTNRWLDEDREGDRSRGLLVRDGLGEASAEDAIRTVEQDLDDRSYDGFSLVALDRDGAFLVESGTQRRVRPLKPGIHVVVNVGADGQYSIPDRRQEVGRQQATNADRIRAELRPEPGEDPRHWLSRASEILGDHEYGVCIHEDGFGTKSASLITVCADGVQYEFAAGPPCETTFERVP